ncbi:MAG: RNA polymerase sigma factor FliA [Candidatus Competibacteraceae bacterium]|nr:RNA polymerase sigma factor FliA [Candidatus Competibacteraceae bacterium]MCB1814446.1 RNA polymerase sigma factor FliA [Candidatus Competibacteraceae bacterium]
MNGLTNQAQNFAPQYSNPVKSGLTADAINDLVNQHCALVRRAAHHLIARLPTSVQIDDLIQAGMLGLLEAAQRFDDSKGASFATFADRRVRGAMLDEIRKNAWAPRSLHRKAREVAAAVRHIETTSGGEAREQDIIAHLGMTQHEYHQVVANLHSHKLLSIEDLGTENEDSDNFLVSSLPLPEDLADQEHMLELLASAIDGLPKREKLVLALYYDEHLNLKEIGAVLGVSESRISQLHSQALTRLKTKLSH